MTSNSVSHCAVMRNPFSTAVASAKIPDGAATLSSSCRYSVSGDITSTDGLITILLYPGLMSGLAVRTNSEAAEADRILWTKRRQDNPKYEGTTRRPIFNKMIGDANALDKSLKFEGDCCNTFRVVAQGLRLALVNNTLDNDGWFEAIRFTPSWNINEWNAYLNEAATSDTNTGIVAPSIVRFEEELIDTDDATGKKKSWKDWSMETSYITGKLRDINAHVFMLHRNGEKDFQEVPNTFDIMSQKTAVSTDIEGANTHQIDKFLGPEKVVFDENMDCIAIRCRANPGTNGQVLMHYHMVSHQEETYDPKSAFARFMTIPPVNRRLTEAVISSIKRDIKPSIVRMPTGGVPIIRRRYRRYTKRRRYVR